jgi:antitoxin HigA-1
MTIARDPNRMGVPVHPGEILLEEFLRPLELSQAALARHLGISQVRVNEIINGKRGISAETAWLLAEAFSTSPQFWVNLQANYDLATNRPSRHVSKIRRTG